MCEQSETEYLDGEVVWVKLGSCFWPGEVVGPDKLPPDLLPSFKKPPIAVVKFFQEETFEYVKNTNSIFKYNCSRKNEFINKGLYMYRTKHGLMEKFPEDVIRAETAVGGDKAILTRDEFQEEKKESYAGLFGDPSKRTPQSTKRAKGKHPQSPTWRTPIRKLKDKTNYKVHILLQGSKTPSTPATDIASPSTSRAGSEPAEEKVENVTEPPVSSYSTPTMSSSGIYSCHACPFTTTRLNVLIMHNKTHSVTFTPYTPVRKPISKKSTPKTPKARKPKQEKNAKVIENDKAEKINQAQKRLSQEKSVESEVKKAKTDEEIKSSLLADWDDVGEDSNDESTMAMTTSPEVPVGAESPDVPTPAELPSAQIPAEIPPSTQKNSEDLQSPEKQESSSDSKYEFCEDEDWSMEADAGRKIPRVKNPSKRKESVKSLSTEDDDVRREVAELLNKTTVPELPSVPAILPVEENFPERAIAKSPDKKNDSNTTENLPEASQASEKKESTDQPHKTIFKTKTFFRSRHSRSQDAIVKYVAEQLNAAERMDLSENETNGIESSSSESRESPVEHVKVARLAPKIQLKRMKAEAALQQEREKNILDNKQDDVSSKPLKLPEHVINITNDFTIEKDETDSLSSQDLMYSTPEITQENAPTNNLNEILEPPETSEPSLPIACDVTTDKDDDFMSTVSQNSVEESSLEKGVVTEDSKEEEFTKSKTHLNLQLDYEHSLETRMTDTAVDALLSVSRETDSVTRVISDDPPEDLFEDEKDNTNVNVVNGFNEIKEIIDDKITEPLIDNESECSKSQTSTLDESSITDNLDTDTNEDKINTNDETNITEEINEIKDKVEEVVEDIVADSMPTESDLQIAEALINLPSTAIKKKPIDSCEDLLNKEIIETVSNSPSTKDLIIEDQVPAYSNENNENIARYESEQEKSENLNAAQSLVQMSECIDHNINFVEIESENKKEASPTETSKPKKTVTADIAIEPKVSLLTKKSTVEQSNGKSVSYNKSSSKLLKILEKPTTPKLAPNKTIISKRVIMPGKEKILNFDVGKQSFKGKPQAIKQNIVIRKSGPPKNILNNISEVSNLNKIILSRSNKPIQDGSSVQTYTIQTPVEPSADPNTILIQPKNRRIPKTLTKIQKIKPQTQTSFVAHIKEKKLIKESGNDEPMFDINSMPIVLSDDILTPESIEKMPIVMSDANIITNSTNNTKMKTKTIVDSEKIALSTVTSKAVSPITNKAEIKTMVMSPSSDAAKVTTPNILSKSAKLRGTKPMLVIEKATGKKKIILPQPESAVKEAKQSHTPTLVPSVSQSGGKTEKYIILPSTNAPRATRTQKIVIDPQTGKAHMFLAKGTEGLTVTDNKAVSAKLIQSSENTAPGNTVMIITNSQGTQSKIVLTPEHEKILFPHKANVSQLKTVTQRITTNTSIVQKPTVTTANAAKGQARIVPRHKGTIITSKGQLIVGGLVPSGTTNIAPMPEIRPALKRIIPAETKKIVHTTHVPKDSSEQVLFYQRKPGTYMQLTAAQFEHLQRTGQLISKSPITQENKVIIQKP
ncbi:PREDICTED: muscle M-line assembly protein unc-89, partial [Papilio polytes]|uniref:muscle M-line assembly protein unc-89 n=1 Tax=Papilio polytes TaxID=76194 RepID=UPI00067610DA